MISGNQRWLYIEALFALALLCIVSGRAIGQAANALVVVVNKSNAEASALNKAEMKKILLGDKSSWSNGSQIAVILKPPGDSDRTAVLQAICQMNEGVFTRRQLQASFSGGTPVVIREVRSAIETKSALKSSPWAVGFLHKSEVDDSVKALFALE
jgi:ABC-type phosphate transport system substrate-binding protein